ncbi:hypothetical protein P3G55_07135 [Leptospira sp. 96542]|nr:hypothetical protein [Leptospira sp. 96542]
MNERMSGNWHRILWKVCLILILVNPIMAEEDEAAKKQEDKKWRLLLGAFAGEFNLQLQTKLAFAHTNPTTGTRELPVLGTASGLTRSGSLDLQLEGIGPQKGFQFMVMSDSLVFYAAYARVDVNFAPMQSPKIGINTAEGNAGGNLYSTGLEYFYALNKIVQPMVGVGHSGFGAYYKVRNVLGRTEDTSFYESFSAIDADDGSRSTLGKIGARIKLPIQSWSVTPYLQYAANRYHINIRSTAGTVQGHENFYPENPQAVINSWFYQDVGSVYTLDSMSQIPREARSVGGVFFFDYKKFISLTVNARRNFNQGAWNISSSLLFFFHPNAGIMASYTYAEPEVLLSFNRSWAIGPVFTATF